KKKKSKQSYVVSSLNFLSPSHRRRFFSGLTISTRDEIPLSQSPHHLISSLAALTPHHLISSLAALTPHHLISSHLISSHHRRHSSTRDEIPIISSHHGHSQISKQVHLKNVICS
ncbi:unnamed protein product, partial [Brassica rapa]